MSKLQDAPFAGRGTSGPLAELDLPPRRRRKKQEEEGEEHGELNLTAMIDMMTILLVFLLKSFSVSTTNINTADVKLPKATAPESIVDATKITLTQTAVLVDEKPVTVSGSTKLSLATTPDGKMFAPELLDPTNDHLVPALKTKLEEAAQKQRKILERQKRDLHSPLLIIADGKIPFRTISQVVYTAGQVSIEIPGPDGKPQKDGWFDEYRFVVIKRAE